MLKPAPMVIALLIVILVLIAAALPACAREQAQSSDRHIYLKAARLLDTKVSELNANIAELTAQWDKGVTDARSNNVQKEELYNKLRYGDRYLEIYLDQYYNYAKLYNRLTDAIDAREIPSGDVPSVKKSLKSTASKLAEIDDMLREHQTNVNEYRQWLRDEFD